MFDLVVKNAIDFLERATEEIEERPKYSIINFFSAVELFFKARLMKEHWSLVLIKPENADIRKFRDGDSRSGPVPALRYQPRRRNRVAVDWLNVGDPRVARFARNPGLEVVTASR